MPFCKRGRLYLRIPRGLSALTFLCLRGPEPSGCQNCLPGPSGASIQCGFSTGDGGKVDQLPAITDLTLTASQFLLGETLRVDSNPSAHFTEEETKTQKEVVTCSGSQGASQQPNQSILVQWREWCPLLRVGLRGGDVRGVLAQHRAQEAPRHGARTQCTLPTSITSELKGAPPPRPLGLTTA